MADTLWIGTRKGLFALRRAGGRWKLTGPQMLGHIIHHVVQDPRDPKRYVHGRQDRPSGADGLHLQRSRQDLGRNPRNRQRLQK